MKIEFKQCEFGRIKDRLCAHIQRLHSPVDSFLEDHILGSNHYEILGDGLQVGYFSIYKESLLTQFYLDPEFRHLGQDLFSQVKRFEQLYKAFIPTCDEFFLSLALDVHIKLEKQAYFFQERDGEIEPHKVFENFSCDQAQLSEIGLIQEKSGDFFDSLEQRINQGDIYICRFNGQPVSFGICERSRIYEATVSIGLFTLEEFRGQGFGRNTIHSLKQICKQQGMRPIAGCWYYNHNSKKTLESAGMYSQTRLLLIHF